MSNYFRKIPDIDYPSLLKDRQGSADTVRVKNLWRRAKIREDVFGNYVLFTKYNVIGDERPDNISYKFYNDPFYDWAILLCNNIINFQDEWPMSQRSFEKYLYTKYVTDANLNSIHHYVSTEVRNSRGEVVSPAGLEVPSNYSITYFDDGRGTEVTATNIAQGITNLQYETKKEEDKRNIFLLKPQYVGVIAEEMDGSLIYREGSSQYKNDYLVKGENIRLYQ